MWNLERRGCPQGSDGDADTEDSLVDPAGRERVR